MMRWIVTFWVWSTVGGKHRVWARCQSTQESEDKLKREQGLFPWKPLSNEQLLSLLACAMLLVPEVVSVAILRSCGATKSSDLATLSKLP